MAYSLRATANARFEILDDRHVIAVAFGRRAGEVIVEALERAFGGGEQQELFPAAA